jgi:hypothetical protein
MLEQIDLRERISQNMPQSDHRVTISMFWCPSPPKPFTGSASLWSPSNSEELWESVKLSPLTSTLELGISLVGLIGSATDSIIDEVSDPLYTGSGCDASVEEVVVLETDGFELKKPLNLENGACGWLG